MFLQEPNDTDLTKVDMDWFEEQVWKWKPADDCQLIIGLAFFLVNKLKYALNNKDFKFYVYSTKNKIAYNWLPSGVAGDGPKSGGLWATEGLIINKEMFASWNSSSSAG